MANCKGCGAKIIWIQTANGKSIPCNPIKVVYWAQKGGKERIVTPNGKVIACAFGGDEKDITGLGYVPHWSTCPKAKDFRRRNNK